MRRINVIDQCHRLECVSTVHLVGNAAQPASGKRNASFTATLSQGFVVLQVIPQVHIHTVRRLKVIILSVALQKSNSFVCGLVARGALPPCFYPSIGVCFPLLSGSRQNSTAHFGDTHVSQNPTAHLGDTHVSQNPTAHLGDTHVSQNPTAHLGDTHVSQNPTAHLGDTNVSQNPTALLGDTHVSQNPTAHLGDTHVSQNPTALLGDTHVSQNPTAHLGDTHVSQNPTALLGDTHVSQTEEQASSLASYLCVYLFT
ncbi:hypothetical protein CHS0354_005669 [Potamilus streckersoni]|uniref:Uncharacterized protein n=1 Tax=Potamilus streckersoni TaxID=2493646 RepID=A0AAE0S0N9_9BIVA|nr:hypothetical protein CHS0354_005669 [Potamilus streckersoni]